MSATKSALDETITLYNSGHMVTPMNGDDMQRAIDARTELAQLRDADIRTMEHCEVCGGLLVLDADASEEAEPFCPYCELQKVRAAAAELQAAHVYLDESYINDPNDPPLELADRCAQLVKTISEQARQLVKTISEQARQLNTARNVISAYRGLPTGPKGYTSMPLFDLHNAADDWLAANAPQPQEQSA